MRVGMVMTVRNEEALLRSNVLYHHHLGVEPLYVYDDGSTDRTREVVSDLPFVRVRSSVPPERFRHREDLRHLCELSRSIPARQCLNACAAIEEARGDGLDWLIHVDADELVCVDLQRTRPGHLREVLASLPIQYAVARFGALEVVQRFVDCEDVFREETLFKSPDGRIRHRLFDPYRRRTWTSDGFYGHKKVKVALRPHVDARPVSGHRFVALDGSNLPTAAVGHLLHYCSYSFRDFLKKYRNLADQLGVYAYASGHPVEYQRRLWHSLVNDPDYTEDDLREYYERWLLFKPREIERLARTRRFGLLPKRPAIVSVTSVREVMAEIARSA